MGSFSKRSQQIAKLYNEGWVEKIVYAEAESSYGIDLGIGLSEGNKVHKMLTFLKIPEKDRVFFKKTHEILQHSKKRGFS